MVDVDFLLDLLEDVREGEDVEREDVEKVNEVEEGEANSRVEDFRIRFPYASYLLDILKLLKAFQGHYEDEVTFEVSNDGLKVQFMEPSRIALIKFRLEPYAFEEFEAPAKATRFTIGVKELLKSLPKKMPRGSYAVLEALEGKVRVRIYGAYGELISEAEPRLLEEENWTDLHLTPWTILATARLSLDDLYDAVRTVKGSSERIKIKVSHDMLVVERFDDESKAKAIFVPNDPRLYELEVHQEAKVVLAVKYFENFLKYARKLADEVKLMIATDKPLIAEAFIPSGELKFYQAPVVEC